MRSPTAALLYSFTPNICTRSAGVDSDLTDEHLDWADQIIVMEKSYRHKIRKRRPDIYAKKKITCLYIPDKYDFCEDDLVSILKCKISKWLGLPVLPSNWNEILLEKRAERKAIMDDMNSYEEN